MAENTIAACDEIESGLLKVRRALDLLEQPDAFKTLTVQELRWLKEHKSSLYTLAKRSENLLETIFNPLSTGRSK